MRINLLLIVIITAISFIGCSSDDDCQLNLFIPTNVNQTVLADNIATIETYLSQNSLIAQKTSSNLYYVVEEEGGLIKPELCDRVTVKYRGFLPNGETFDQSTAGITFSLSAVIIGWQEGIPLFGEGGKGTLLIPSYLAYGKNPPPNSIIPEDSVLLFEIELVSF